MTVRRRGGAPGAEEREGAGGTGEECCEGHECERDCHNEQEGALKGEAGGFEPAAAPPTTCWKMNPYPSPGVRSWIQLQRAWFVGVANKRQRETPQAVFMSQDLAWLEMARRSGPRPRSCRKAAPAVKAASRF